MPVTWSISRDERLVLVAAEGDVALKDFEQYMSAVATAGAMPYRKLIDVTYISHGTLRIAELKSLARTMVAYAQRGAVGPVAIVVGSELERELAEVIDQAGTGRAVAIFQDRSEARKWLDGSLDLRIPDQLA